MPLVNGTLTDFGLDPLTVNNPIIYFRASSTGVAGLNILSARKAVDVTPAANGYFEVDLVATAAVAPADLHYMIEIRYRETSTGLMVSEVLPWKLYVPSEGGALGDLLREPTNPALVYTGTEPPLDPSAGSWWLDSETADLAEWDGAAWQHKANLRGPAGFNATGAAEDDAAIAAFLGSSTSTTGKLVKSSYVPSVTVGPYYGSYGAGNDQAAFDAAIDHLRQMGGGKLVVPAGYVPKVSQLVIDDYIELCGSTYWNTFGRSGNVARIEQLSGVNIDTVVFDNAIDSQYGATRPFIGPLSIHDLVFSKPAGAGGHHINVRTQDGREAKIQDFSTFTRLGFRGGQKSGMNINGGSPVILSHMAGIGLGGYVLEIVDLGRDATHGDIHQVSASNISGDACMGYAADNYGAVILLKGTVAHTVQTFRDIKSEHRVRLPSDGGDPAETTQSLKKMGNKHALILENCQSSVIVSGVGHIATGDTATTPQTRRPGAAILIKGANRPKLSYEGVKIRVTASQTEGAMPGAVRDEVSATPVDVPMESSAGSYATTLDRRDLAASSNGTRWIKGVPGQTMPSIASPADSLGGATPTRSWYESDADANEKIWSMPTSGGNWSLRTHADDGSAGVLAIEAIRNGTDVTEMKFNKKVTAAEFENTTASGHILKSANGTRYRVTVTDAGTLAINPA